MKLSKEARKRISDEREKLLEKMSVEGISEDDWKAYKQRYDGYSDMLKRNWKVSPDALVTVAGNLLGILLILNFEKADIITTKALGFVLKGRV